MVTTSIYNFWLYELCDIYIEYIKQDFFSSSEQRKETVKLILYTCLNNGLRLLAPIMPYLAEELYQRLPKPTDNEPPSLCVTLYPQPNDFKQYCQEEIESEVTTIYECINKIRSYRSAHSIVSKQKDNLYIQVKSLSSSLSTLFSTYGDLIQRLANINEIQINTAPAGEQEQEKLTLIASTDNYDLYFIK